MSEKESEMEKKSLKSIFFRRMLQGHWKLDIKGTEAIFLVLCTLVEICFPLYFLFAKHKMEFPYNILMLFGTIFALFFIFMDIRTFFQSNYIDLVFFQICTYIILVLITLVLFILKRQNIAQIVEVSSSSGAIWLVLLYLYVIFLGFSFICIFMIDFVFVVLLLLLAGILGIDLENQYMQKLSYAQTIEGSEEYTRKRLKEEYEERFQESNINDASFEQYCKEKYSNEPYVQTPLFENTKYFRQIVSLEQVKARYQMLMEIYQADKGSSNALEICKEIEEEYKEIKKKYNIKDK